MDLYKSFKIVRTCAMLQLLLLVLAIGCSKGAVLRTSVSVNFVGDVDVGNIFEFDIHQASRHINQILTEVSVFYSELTTVHIDFNLTNIGFAVNDGMEPFKDPTNQTSGPITMQTLFYNFKNTMLFTQFNQMFADEAKLFIIVVGNNKTNMPVAYNIHPACPTKWILLLATLDHFNSSSVIRALNHHACDTWNTVNCRVFANQLYFHPNTDTLLGNYLASANKSCFWDSRSSKNIQETNVESATASDQCRLYYNTTDIMTPSVVGCKQTQCYRKSDQFVLGTITPIYNTSCGIHKICAQGSCVWSGFKIQSLSNNLCMEVEYRQGQSKFILAKCRETWFPAQIFMFHNSSTPSEVYIMPRQSGIKSSDKICMEVDNQTNKILALSCNVDGNSDGWTLQLHQSTNEFTFYHSRAKVYLGVKGDGNLVLQASHTLSEKSFLWKLRQVEGTERFFPRHVKAPMLPFYVDEFGYVETTTINPTTGIDVDTSSSLSSSSESSFEVTSSQDQITEASFTNHCIPYSLPYNWLSILAFLVELTVLAALILVLMNQHIIKTRVLYGTQMQDEGL